MTLTESDIRKIPSGLVRPNWLCRGWAADVSCRGTRYSSFLGDFDGDLRTIGLREPRLVLEPGRHGAVADFVRIAEFVEIEQFRRQRFAASVALTLVLVDAYLEFSGHHKPLSWLTRRDPRRG